MPLYDFECPEHGKFETVAAMGVNEVNCPACAGPAARLFSPPRGENALLITAGFREGHTDTEANQW